MSSVNAAETDPSFTMAAEWHRVTGTRLTRFLRVMSDPLELFIISCLCVILEPYAFLTKMFMKYSTMQRNYSKSPPIFDLIWDRTSIICYVLQYLSWLLTGRAARLRMIYCRQGYNTFKDWHDARPDQVSYLRGLILMAIGLVELRLHQRTIRVYGASNHSSGAQTRSKHTWLQHRNANSSYVRIMK